MSNKLFEILKIFVQFKLRKKIIPVCYFNEVPNVGDALNVELIEFISNKKVVKTPSTKIFKHLCGVGSVLSSMNHNSIVWGSGFISENAIENVVSLGDVRAVRGYYSKNKLQEKFKQSFDVALGDPALLLPLIFKAADSKKYEFGLVLHYIDKEHPILNIVNKLNGKVIDVGLSVSEFVNELTQCKIIISSSMHGLIIADAYNIPNQRLILSNNIVGGDFKYMDYYSTSDKPDAEGIVIENDITEDKVFEILKLASVKRTTVDLELLYNAFPHDKF
jgi:pyruvyltransferase